MSWVKCQIPTYTWETNRPNRQPARQGQAMMASTVFFSALGWVGLRG
ncbi:MAG: hypothetical protein QOF52_1453, partial [Propionibacteriaceae bacterium]|nr:hypothetical protein [Propionibacteriaceae bacterium]